MRAATIDNVNIGAGWVPVLDHSCSGHGEPLALTLDFTADARRDVQVTAEIAWFSLRGRAQAIVDVPVVLRLGGPCVVVRARAIGVETGQPVSVSAQLIAADSAAPTQPTFTERLTIAEATAIQPVPRWARQLHMQSVNPYAQSFTQLDMFADAAGTDLLARTQLNAPVIISPRVRWRRFVNVDANLLLVWTLRL